MRRELHVRFCEGGGVRFPSATRLIYSLALGTGLRLAKIVGLNAGWSHRMAPPGRGSASRAEIIRGGRAGEVSRTL